MNPIKTYACCNICEEIRIRSSSGAVFSLLAEYVLSQNGVVYGVAMSDDCYSAKFIAINKLSELDKLRGSKYLQAKVGDAFLRARDDLEEGKSVLFSGTGCQINGLKNYLGKEYAGLICVDVICHGVPSPALWKTYVLHQEKRYGSKLKTINFRCKDYGWIGFGMKENQVFIPKEKDVYMQMFLRNYCLRPSCYECVAKNVKLSDFTVADFWGIDAVAPEMNDGKGTSLVLIRSEKGIAIFEKIKNQLNVKEVTYEDGVKRNPAEYKSADRPPQRDSFFPDMRSMEFEELERKYAAPIKLPLKIRFKKMIRTLRRICTWGVKRRNEEYGSLLEFEGNKI